MAQPRDKSAVATITKGVTAQKNVNSGLDSFISPAVKPKLEIFSNRSYSVDCSDTGASAVRNTKWTPAGGLQDVAELVSVDEELQSMFLKPFTDQVYSENDSGCGSDDPFRDAG